MTQQIPNQPERKPSELEKAFVEAERKDEEARSILQRAKEKAYFSLFEYFGIIAAVEGVLSSNYKEKIACGLVGAFSYAYGRFCSSLGDNRHSYQKNNLEKSLQSNSDEENK